MGHSHATFVQTEAQKAYFSKKTQKRIAVLPNPVCNEMFEIERTVPERIGRIVSVGRLAKQKNFPLVIDAVKELHDDGYCLSLSIYGDGELREALQRYIDERGAGAYCRLCARSNHMASVYEEHDVFVLSSDFEGMPNALMEAMAAGMPCIATDCETGPGDLIQDGVNGMLIPVRDKEKLKTALKRIVQNRSLACKLGAQARASMHEHYSARQIGERFIAEVVLRENT